MSNPNRSRASWIYPALAFVIQALICFPLAAGTPPTDPDKPGRSSTKPLQIAAIAPSSITDVVPPRVWMERRDFRRKLDEARAILQELQTFANTAQRAIRMGEKIRALRLDNKRLKQDITDDAVGGHDLKRDLFETDIKTSSLTETVVANWLISMRLRHQSTVDDSRLISAKVTWVKAEERLASLRRQVAEHRNNARNLRAKSAALAAEIGRTRRQIINLKEETRLTDDDRQAIETMTRQLRHEVSAGLRTLLAAD